MEETERPRNCSPAPTPRYCKRKQPITAPQPSQQSPTAKVSARFSRVFIVSLVAFGSVSSAGCLGSYDSKSEHRWWHIIIIHHALLAFHPSCSRHLLPPSKEWGEVSPCLASSPRPSPLGERRGRKLLGLHCLLFISGTVSWLRPLTELVTQYSGKGGERLTEILKRLCPLPSAICHLPCIHPYDS